MVKTGNHDERVRNYELATKQLKCMVDSEADLIANMANAVALLKEISDWHWIGFYRVVESQLVLGPFQGPVACTRIGFGKGVCGTSWERKETLNVPDVEKFAGHIACSSLSKSEIVIPIFNQDEEVYAVLDIDSVNYSDFDAVDQHYLELFCKVL